MIAKPKPLLRRGSAPLSRILEVDDVKDTPLDVAFEAEPAELEAIAAEAGLQAVGRLAARLVVRRRSGGLIEVSGAVDATVTETCVLSLDPFEQRLTNPVMLRFAPAQDEEVVALRGRDRRAGPHAEPAPRAVPPRTVSISSPDEREDEPDPIVDGRIDLGAVAVEFMNLAREPYPKKPDVHFPDVLSEDDVTEEPSALALALGRLKDRS